MAALFLLVLVYRNWINISYISFFLGGIIGTLLPYVDYLIYAYVMQPNASVSKEAVGLISKKDVVKSVNLMISSDLSKKDLIFHTVWFQLIFLLFTFFVVTSSGNIFGWGIVLAFSLHLFIDQVVELVENKNFDSWFEGIPYQLDKLQKKFYLVGVGALLLVMSFLL
jgi:hypothetical protein